MQAPLLWPGLCELAWLSVYTEILYHHQASHCHRHPAGTWHATIFASMTIDDLWSIYSTPGHLQLSYNPHNKSTLWGGVIIIPFYK